MGFDPKTFVSSTPPSTWGSGFDPIAFLSGKPQPKPSTMDLVKQSALDVIQKPAAYVKDLATNPETMAKALPAALGTLGAISPIPGAATVGTVGGRQLSNEALRILGKEDQIPSQKQQLLEGALSAAGDVVGVPAIKKSIFGNQIGAAENAAGVVTQAADRYPTSGTVGEVLNTLEKQIDSGAITDPNVAKQAYDITDFIHKNPTIVGKSNAIKVQAYRVGAKAQSLLNSIIPDRAAPAEALADSQTIPRAIGQAWNAVPPWGKRGIQFGAGAVGAEGLLKALGERK